MSAVSKANARDFIKTPDDLAQILGEAGKGMNERTGEHWRALDRTGAEWSGAEWSGMEWNGMEWNGVE
jgi:hypothetical protein